MAQEIDEKDLPLSLVFDNEERMRRLREIDNFCVSGTAYIEKKPTDEGGLMAQDARPRTALETPYDPLTPIRAEIGTLALQLSASGRKIEAEVSALVRQRDEYWRIIKENGLEGLVNEELQ